ncbi:leucine-rich repeat protein [Eggerthellaceae bacterium zg-887]|uniref:leucine-rich repeat protein n=1 Tax=Xiamenia xianingshaonis TaxID=2682776 RepID=UPI001408749F|nr:leucine-rich repeat protein [Xiamenia xianingshaonis]NHM16427.1 leucine-rich repeat protein [Xiamenia xianingshaonis]
MKTLKCGAFVSHRRFRTIVCCFMAVLLVASGIPVSQAWGAESVLSSGDNLPEETLSKSRPFYQNASSGTINSGMDYLSDADAIAFIRFIYNDAGTKERELEAADGTKIKVCATDEVVRSSEIYKLLTGVYANTEQENERKLAFLSLLEGQINGHIQTSTKALDYLHKDLQAFAEYKLSGMKDIPEQEKSAFANKLLRDVEDYILDIACSVLGQTTGIYITESHIEEIRLAYSTYQDILDLPKKIENFVKTSKATVQAAMLPLQSEFVGRYEYFSSYLSCRSLGSPGDPAFDTAMDYNFFAAQQNGGSGALLINCIPGKKNWTECRVIIDRWAEFAYQLERSVANPSSGSGGNESGGNGSGGGSDDGSGGGSDDGSGEIGTLEWSYSDGTLTISGSGAMPNWFVYDPDHSYDVLPPWASYQDDIVEVVIGEGITTVGDYAFYRYGLIQRVSLPKSLKIIGEGAFGYCVELEGVRIPSGVRQIGDIAFVGCRLIKELDFPTTMDSLGVGVLEWCRSLERVSLPQNLKEIPAVLFSGCYCLKSITIPYGVTTIGSNAFEDCNLTEIVIPATLVEIKPWAFEWAIKDYNYCNVYYGGTSTDWGRISFSDNEEWFTNHNATVYCLGNPAPTKTFTLGEDSNSFIHAFYNVGASYYIPTAYFNALKKKATSSEVSRIKKYASGEVAWGGTCYGISSSMLLAYTNQMPLTVMSNRNPACYYSMQPKNEPAVQYSLRAFHLSQMIGGYKTVIAQSSSKRYLPSLLNTMKSYLSSSRSPFLLTYFFRDSQRNKTVGHVVVLVGNTYEEHDESWSVKVYDPNSVNHGTMQGDWATFQAFDNGTFVYSDATTRGHGLGSLTESNFNTLRFEQVKNPYVLAGGIGNATALQNTARTMAYSASPDFAVNSSLDSSASTFASNQSTGTIEVTVPMDGSLTIQNAAGKNLDINGDILSGDIEILDEDYLEFDEESKRVLTIANSSEFKVESPSDAIEVEFSNDEKYLSVDAENVEEASVSLDDGVVLEGDDYSFEVWASTDEMIAENEKGLYSMKGKAKETVEVQVESDCVVVAGEKAIEDFSAAIYNETSKDELVQDEKGGSFELSNDESDGSDDPNASDTPSGPSNPPDKPSNSGGPAGSSAPTTPSRPSTPSQPETPADSGKPVKPQTPTTDLAEAAKIQIDSSIDNVRYTGKPITPQIVVTAEGKVLVEGKDYDLIFKDNTNAGTAYVTVAGKGAFKGTKTFEFTIGPAQLNEVGTLELAIESVLATGEEVIPEVVVKAFGNTLEHGKDYDVKYASNIEPGEAVVTVSGKGNYAGEISGTFTIEASENDSTVPADSKVPTNLATSESPSGPERVGWQQLSGGEWAYWLDNDTKAVAQWLWDGSRWYHFSSSGIMQSGWLYDKGNWYLLNTRHDGAFGSMLTGWQQMGGDWYYFAQDGAMVSGWLRDGGAWYLLNTRHDGTYGAALSGWQKVGSHWYWLHDRHDGRFGKMHTGWLWDSGAGRKGRWYYFKPSGSMAVNEWIGRYYLGATGAWEL